MSNLIQIKRSSTNAAPLAGGLVVGELAYSFLNTSNSLFVGDLSNNALRIAGGKYQWLHQANTGTPGALTANAVVILNGNGYTTETRTNKLILGADGTTINVASINATSNSTVLGASTNTELATTYAIQNYVELKTASLGGSIPNEYIVFSDGGTLAGNAALTFTKANSTVHATGNVVVGQDIVSNGSIRLQGANGDIEILQGGAHLNLSNYLLVATANVNSYAQIGLQNKGAGDNANASADFVAYPPGPHVDDTSGFINMGIGGNSYSQAAYSITQGFEGYLFMSALSGSAGSGSLVIATDSTGTNNAIRFYTNGFSQAVGSAAMIIDRNQRIGIANVTPAHTLSVGGNAYFANISSFVGAATFSNNVSISGNANVAGTLAVGNTTSTGFINVVSYGTFGGTVNAAALNIAGAATTGNVSITGTANATVGINVGANVNLTTSSINVGNTTVNTQITAGNINLNGSQLFLGNSTVNTTITGAGLTTTGFVNAASGMAMGNTDVTGHLTVSTYGNFGGVVNTGGLNVSGDVGITGNLTVSGTLTTINTVDLTISDGLVRVANGNASSDTLDIGVFGSFGNATATQYTGLFRDQTDGIYKLFAGVIPVPTTTVDTTNTGFALADLSVNYFTAAKVTSANAQITGGTITGITDLTVGDGGTGRSLFANNGIIYGQNTSALAVTSAGNVGDVLQAGVGGVPQFGTLDGGSF